MAARTLEAELLSGEALYRRVVLEKMTQARESVLIATANVKAMLVELKAGQFRPIADLFAQLSKRGVVVKLLHAELPSRPFREAFDKHERLCPDPIGPGPAKKRSRGSRGGIVLGHSKRFGR
jgi:hypothetical protein